VFGPRADVFALEMVNGLRGWLMYRGSGSLLTVVVLGYY
jgi:hypothetical protein